MYIQIRSVAATVAFALLAACSGGDGGDATTSSFTSTVTVPGAPTIGAATAGNASASIAFTAPASNGGATITAYTATCSASGQTTRTGSGTASPIAVSTLTNATAYACSVTATNSAGTSAASASVNVTPVAATTGTTSTASVLCPYSISTPVTLGNGTTLTSTASWTCSGTTRALSGNAIPNHTTGIFPNTGNPNTISAQVISFSATTAPVLSTTSSTGSPTVGYALNSVKFEPGTAGTCASTVTAASQCNLANGAGGTWRVEALGQTAFDFGVDSNFAHVQPTGEYHYHGIPIGMLTNDNNTGQKMTLVGWANDGFPVYARYGYTDPTSASSAIKTIRGSYVLDTVPDSGRPSVTIAALGAFTTDWNYSAGSGDLDDCNGRTGVTPEFPAGIYHYYLTDTYPYQPRCRKGS